MGTSPTYFVKQFHYKISVTSTPSLKNKKKNIYIYTR